MMVRIMFNGMCSTNTVTPRLELLIKCLVNFILCTDDILTASSYIWPVWVAEERRCIQDCRTLFMYLACTVCM